MSVRAFVKSGKTKKQRAALTAALIARALDPDDLYDGHHGNDRSEASLEHARQNNPDLAARIQHNIDTRATE